jgi:hypothetical protein
MSDQQKALWYDNNFIVIILLIIFFPIGLYGLWKNKKISKNVKIIVSIFFGLLIITASGSENKPSFDLKKEKENQLFHIAYESETSIKQNLKDPQSYEMIDKDYKFLSDTIYEVNITYSATNSFGGRIQNKYLKMGVLKFNPKDTSFVNIVTFEK